MLQQLLNSVEWLMQVTNKFFDLRMRRWKSFHNNDEAKDCITLRIVIYYQVLIAEIPLKINRNLCQVLTPVFQNAIETLDEFIDFYRL